MKKRITALFLLVCMLLTLLPVGALADEDEGGPTPAPVVEPAPPQNEGGEGGSGTGGSGSTHTHTWGAWTDAGDTHTRKCADTDCNATENGAHDYAYTSNGDGTHTGKCKLCGKTLEPEACSGGTATCKEKAKCAKCGESYGELSTEHKLVYRSNSNGTHNIVCEVCNQVQIENEACSGGEATCKEPAKCEKCGESYGTVNADAHKPSAQPRHVAGTETHEYYCELCNKTLKTEACTKTEATCAEPAKCTECGETYGEASATHTGKSIYKANTDGTTHSLVCETCGNPLSDVKAPHKEATKPRPVAGTKTHEYYCEVCQAATRNAENCTPKCVSNKDGTHNVVCEKCGQTLEENVACTPNKTNVKCGTTVKCTVCKGSYKLPHDRDANGACKRFSTDSKKNKCSCTAEKHQKQWTKANANQDTLTCRECGNTIQKKEIDVSINISGYKEGNKPSSLTATSGNGNVKPGKPKNVTPNDAKFKKGSQYTVTVPFTVEPGYKIKSLKISGVTATPMQLDDGSWAATAELPAVEEMVTLTFKTNGGKTMSPLNVTKGTKITKDELKDKYTPTRSGYWFSGWYEESTFKTKVTELTVNEDTTIYAKWKKEDTTNPKTGDPIGLAVGVLALTTVLGAAVVTKKKRTR